jgi:hypothetical protein
MQKINTLIILSIIIGGCKTPIPQEQTTDRVKTISMDSKTKHYNIGRKDTDKGVFKGDITFNSSDEYISIENSKWVLPLELKVLDKKKVIWNAKLGGEGGNNEVKFKIPTDVLKSGYKIEVKSFTGVVMDSKIK